MGASVAVLGATTKAVFETYIERVLTPSLESGQIVLLDNLAAHKGQRVEDLIEARGCELLYLAPYSPEYNPIEEAFSKIKATLRKAEARTRQTLVKALGVAIWAVTAADARGYFEHGGYYATVHPL